MPAPEIRIASIVSAPFEENSYVAHLEGNSACLIFDPGFEPELIIEYVEKENLIPVAFLCTHGHSDHIAGNEAMKDRWPEVPLLIGEKDAPMLIDPMLNLSGPFGMDLISPPADQTLKDGEIYEAAGIALEVREIPGHSPGHVVFVWHAGDPKYVFGGDCLFSGSIGRTDFPGGSFPQLRDGIHKKLFTLPPDTIVLPGHGPATLVGEEKRNNPFVGEAAR